MKTLEEIKIETAKEQGYTDAEDIELAIFNGILGFEFYDEVTERYADEKLQEATEKIERQKLKSDREPSKSFNIGCDNSITLIKSLQTKNQ